MKMMTPPLIALALSACTPHPPQLPLSQVTMYRKAGSGAEVLLDGAVVSAGDQLRACVRGPRGHVSLLGQDGTGAVTIYGSWPIGPGAAQCAPFALEIDAAPGPEAFWLIATPRAQAHVPIHRPAAAVGWRFPKS